MMEQLTDHRYEVLAVPEDAAANCIYVRGANQRDFLLHRPAEECPESMEVGPQNQRTLTPRAESTAQRKVLWWCVPIPVLP